MTEARANMEGFLRTLDEHHQTIKHRGLPALLLAGGRWFTGRGNAADYELTRRWKKNRPKAKECFHNAQSFCLDHDEGRYFEGYALRTPTGLPTEHGWVVMPDGNVVDFTFEAMELVAEKKGLSCDTKDAVYFGVEVPTEFVRETMLIRDAFKPVAEAFDESRRPAGGSVVVLIVDQEATFERLMVLER